MTKKDFELIANCINVGYQQCIMRWGLDFQQTSLNDEAAEAVYAIENSFVEQLKANNPRFNEDKFRAACNRGIPQ